MCIPHNVTHLLFYFREIVCKSQLKWFHFLQFIDLRFSIEYASIKYIGTGWNRCFDFVARENTDFIYNNNKILDHPRQIEIEDPVKLILISMVNDLKLLSCGSNWNPCFEGLKCNYTKIHFSKCTLDAEMWFTHLWFIPSNISILPNSIMKKNNYFHIRIESINLKDFSIEFDSFYF